MGLLDNIDSPEMGFAMGLLQAGGASPRPVGIGQGLAMGLRSAQEAKQNQQIQAFKQMQMDEYKRKIAQEQGQDAAQEQLFGGLDPQMRTLFKAYPSLAAEYLKPKGPSELKEIKTLRMGDKIVPVSIFKDGTTKPLDGYELPPDIVIQDVGGKLVAVDKNSLRGGESMTKTMTPDAVDSSKRGWAAFNLDNQRFGLDKQKFGFEQTKFATEQANGKPLTESQGAAANFGIRAAKANEILNGLGGDTQPGFIKRNVESLPLVGDYLGNSAAVNWTQSDKQQQTEQAQRDFINAVLRKESGATISPTEFDNARKQYFPQPGDGAAVIEQKKRNRETAVSGLALQAGTAAGKVTAGTVVDFSQLPK